MNKEAQRDSKLDAQELFRNGQIQRNLWEHKKIMGQQMLPLLSSYAIIFVMKKEIAGSNRITNSSLLLNYKGIFMKKSLKLKLTVRKQPVKQPKLTSLPLELTKEDNGQRMANMEEIDEQVARKFTNLAEDSDHSQTMDADTWDHTDHRAQTSSGSSSFEKIGISWETNYVSISNP
uniref:Uncharacterized protein n=1 Tax=Romanomermis culicivorax TaxID=13658 RepID=A0A915JIE4_ROMCU